MSDCFRMIDRAIGSLAGLLSLCALPSHATVLVNTWGTSGQGPGQFNSPMGVAIDATDHVYVADMLNHRIQVFDLEGGYLFEFGTTRQLLGYPFTPMAVACAPNGTVYTTDAANSCVDAFTSQGDTLLEFGHPGNDAEPGAFSVPRAIAITPDGEVWVVDSNNGTVQTFTLSGVLLSHCCNVDGYFGAAGIAFYRGFSYITSHGPDCLPVCGGPNGGFGSRSDGPFPLYDPYGIAITPFGRAYVVERGASRIHEYSITGDLITAWGQRGSALAEMRDPTGVALDRFGNPYVVDTGNNRIKKFAPGPTRARASSWGVLKAMYR